MRLEIDINELAEKVQKAMYKTHSVWEDYVPIVKKNKEINIYLLEHINAPGVYAEMYQTLVTAPKGSTINLHINNSGGNSDGASIICEGIRKSKGKVVANLTGLVASAATLITMECDDIVTAPDVMFMIHESSFGGLSGKFSDVKTFNDFYREFTKDMTKYYYKGFLTDEEIENMHNGKELWFNSNEVLERWKRKKELNK